MLSTNECHRLADHAPRRPRHPPNRQGCQGDRRRRGPTDGQGVKYARQDANLQQVKTR